MLFILAADQPTGRYIVLADFRPPIGCKDKLTINMGDYVQVIVRDESGWWIARMGSEEGYFTQYVICTYHIIKYNYSMIFVTTNKCIHYARIRDRL